MEKWTKPFKVGMYGGKFLPLHKGHELCIQVGSVMCDKLYVLLFYTKSIHEPMAHESSVLDLSLEARKAKVAEICSRYDNVEFVFIDSSSCVLENGEEDWDAETPLVLEACGQMDAVFSSEPGYDAYFKRAYPWATHLLVDEERVDVPISATEIRHMDLEEASKWII